MPTQFMRSILVLLGCLCLLTTPIFASDTVSPEPDIVDAQEDPAPSAATTANGQSPCYPLDVVLVIDQSQSMATSDPRNLRIAAARDVIQLLYQNAAIYCEGRVTHRIAAIGFNDLTEAIIPLTEIFVASAARSEWQQEANTLKSSLRSRPSGQTAVYSALLRVDDGISAESILEEAPDLGDQSIRRQVIFLITDGAPCTATGIRRTNCGSDWTENYFFANKLNLYAPDEWQDDGFEGELGLIEALQVNLDPGVNLNVLFFGNPDLNSYGKTGQAWQQIVSNFQGKYLSPAQLGTPENVTAELNTILEPLIGVQTNLVGCNEPFILEPYVSSTTLISAIRPNTNFNLIITDPTGREISPGSYSTYDDSSINYVNEETIERYTISEPIPGEWRLRSNDPTLCSTLDARWSTKAVDVLLSPLPGDVIVNINEPFTDESGNFYAEFSLLESVNAEPFEVLEAYPLEVCGQIRGPLGNPVEGLPACLPFAPVEGQAGIWRSQPLPAPRQGTYTITISGEVTSIADSSNKIPIFEVSGSYTTAAPLELAIEPVLDAPLNQEGTTYLSALNTFDFTTNTQVHRGLPVALRFVTKDNNTPQAITTLFPELTPEQIGEAIEVDLIDPNPLDKPVVETISLHVSPDDPTLLVGMLRETPSGDQLDREGNYTVRFRLTSAGEAGYNQENFDIVTPTAEISVERVEQVGVQITAIPDVNPAQVLLNTISNNERINQPVPIQVRLSDHTGKAISSVEVFGEELAHSPNLIIAVMRGPNNAIVDRTSLQMDDNSDSVFDGVLVNNTSTDLTDPGTYTIDITFGSNVDLPEEKLDDYTLISTAERPLNIAIERLPRFGVNVANVSTTVKDKVELDLNTIEDGEQKPEKVEFRAQLRDLNGNPYNEAQISEMIDVEGGRRANELVTVIVTNPNGEVLEGDMTLGNNGIFTYTFDRLTNNTDAPIDPAGQYTVRFEINPAAFPASPLHSYEIVDNRFDFSFNRREIRAVRLVLEQIGGQADPVPGQAEPITVPLYLTVGEAIGTPLLPTGGNPQEVSFRLALRDTNDQTVEWNSILILPTDDTGTPVALHPEDIIRVSVTQKGNSPITVNNLQAERVGEEYVLTGTIAEDASTNGEYTLAYSLDGNYFVDTVQNLSDTQSSVVFERDITNFYLNPTFWIVIEVIIIVLILLYLSWLGIINMLTPLTGKIEVTYAENVDNPRAYAFRIAGPKFFRNRKTTSYRIQQKDGKPVEIEVTVWRAGKTTPPKVAMQGAAGAAPAGGAIIQYAVEVLAVIGSSNQKVRRPTRLRVSENNEARLGAISVKHTNS